MQKTMHVEVRSLAPPIRSALDAVGYRARDVPVLVTAGLVDQTVPGGSGQRGFAVAVNLDTGAREVRRGSWGGANIFSPGNPVDLDRRRVRVPDNCVLIKGTEGHPRVMATVYASPRAVGGLLPESVTDDTTDEEQQALYCFGALTGGAGRREELARRGVRPATVDSLVARGYLARNSAGSTRITTRGKNARDDSRAR